MRILSIAMDLFFHFFKRPARQRILPLFFGLVAFSGHANADLMPVNPIGKLARVFNPRLVQMEERIDFLQHQAMSLAAPGSYALKNGIGYRGTKKDPSDPDPSVTLDLGREFPIESIFLVPLQAEYNARMSLFPKKFTIECSNTANFKERDVIFQSENSVFPARDGMPVFFAGGEKTARYVRLVVHQGDHRGDTEIFGLSEFVVISNGYPVSFGSDVRAVGSLDVKDLWYPETLTDGRMPLGYWQGSNWTEKEQRGDMFYVAERDQLVSWTMSFDQERSLDLVSLFPYDVREILEGGILPEEVELQVRSEPSNDFQTVAKWMNPMPGINHETPILFRLTDIKAKELRIVGLRPREATDTMMYGLSEIEAWSDQEKISLGREVIRISEGREKTITTLTNGFSSERQIISVGAWLTQLHQRWKVEHELDAIQPMRWQMAAESELNVTWGASMLLSLTFLIPVFIVERRRLISRNQMDQLRRRIASDLHDDIGSNLGSISLIARTARKALSRVDGPKEVGDDLQEMESIALESSLAMRDIVWLLERKQDSIGDLVQRMKETAGRLLREIDYSVESQTTKSTKSTLKLSLDAKRHLFLFYKEAIHNIVKHSQATKVTIRLWDEGDKLALEVTDNGLGLPTIIENGRETPHPVRKLNERARVLEGLLNMNSTKDQGTQILLTVKKSFLIATHPLCHDYST